MIKRYWKFAAVAAAVVLLIIVAASLCGGPTPRERAISAAEDWRTDSIDAFSEDVLYVVVDLLGDEGLIGELVAELGAEWLESRINELVQWRLSQPTAIDEYSFLVVATGEAVWDVDIGPLDVTLSLSVPINLTISGDDVVDEEIQLQGIRLDLE